MAWACRVVAWAWAYRAVASAWACMAAAWAFEVCTEVAAFVAYIEVVVVGALELELDKERVYIEVDLVQELVLGMAVEREQGMAEEQVQVCTEEKREREVSA